MNILMPVVKKVAGRESPTFFELITIIAFWSLGNNKLTLHQRQDWAAG